VRRKEQQRQHEINQPQPPFPTPLRGSWGGGRELSLGRREG